MRYSLLSKGKDKLFDHFYNPKSRILPDPFSQPVKKTEVLINQKAFHTTQMKQIPCQNGFLHELI
jgi:hypothetical protein